MTIPYNEAGQQAFEVFYRIAEKLFAAAQAATGEYIMQNYPQSRTLGESHADGKYHRTICQPEGHEVTVVYDYRSKQIEIA